MSILWKFRDTRRKFGYWAIRKFLSYVDNHFVMLRENLYPVIGMKWEGKDEYSMIYETPQLVHCYHLSEVQAVAIAKWILASSGQIPGANKTEKYVKGKVIRFPGVGDVQSGSEE